MDKETLSNYGWIVICTLVLAIMIALATPFGEYIRDGVWSVTNGLNDTLNKNMEIAGLSGSGEDNNTPSNESKIDGFQFGDRYICSVDYEDEGYLYDYYFIFNEDGSGSFGSMYYNGKYDFPADSFSYTDTAIIVENSDIEEEIFTNEFGGGDYDCDTKITDNGASFTIYIRDDEEYQIATFTHESLINFVDESIDVDGYATFTDGTTLTWTELKEEYAVTNNMVYPYAFEDCTTLKTIKIPNTVKAIGKRAFIECETLTDAIISEGVEIISQDAFSCCSSLESITIPKTIKSLKSGSSGTFYNCRSLKNVYISDLTAWCNIDINDNEATPFWNGADLYLNGELVTNLVIPNGVTEIKPLAFYKCKSITSVTIPDSVTTIGYLAFNNCTSLANITIPDSVTSIGDELLNGTPYYNDNSNWKDNTLYIGNHLIKAREYFSGSYEIGANVKSIAGGAFHNCSLLTSVTIPEGITTINDYTFNCCSNLTNIIIPDSVTYIGENAFRYCESLTKITIPNNVTYIGRYAFKYCHSLSEITIPNGVTFINDGTFSRCLDLSKIIIPSSVTLIGANTFYLCNSLESIIFEGTMEQWNSIKKGYDWNYRASISEIVCSDGIISL